MTETPYTLTFITSTDDAVGAVEIHTVEHELPTTDIDEAMKYIEDTYADDSQWDEAIELVTITKNVMVVQSTDDEGTLSVMTVIVTKGGQS